MIVTIKPSSYIAGKVLLPTSKSYSIRAFLIAACGGRSTIVNPSNCDDAKVALKTARALGAKIRRCGDHVWEVDASNKKCRVNKINVNESGTVLRFLLPLASLEKRKITITGKGTLKGRPNLFLTRTLRGMGKDIGGSGKKEGIPIVLKGGMIRGGVISIDGSLSSQFISALLIACPQLDESTELYLTGKKLVSSDYIEMTTQVLKTSRVNVDRKSARKYCIKGKQKFTGLKKFNVPSDYGLAAFLLAAGALVKSNIQLSGYLSDDLIQADGKIFNVLDRMGAKYSKTLKSLAMRGPSLLKGRSISLKDAPDLVPIVSILALFAKGKTRLYDIKHARAKESDRISDLRKELLKIGAKVEEKPNELIIIPQAEYKKNCLLNPHNDHRLAMAFCVLGLRIGTRVKNIECSSKSYPDFLKDLRTLMKKSV